MVGTVAQLDNIFEGITHSKAKEIGVLWDKLDNQRESKKAEWNEVRNFVFATNTQDTAVGDLPWKNKTTLPKLCQIRDNLHSNYISSLFPNDAWIKWEGKDFEEDTVEKKDAIQGYMSTKARQSGLRDVESTKIYDYIDFGNAFGFTRYVKEGSYDPVAGREIGGYKGPKAFRISPLDLVFDPTASDFYMTPKVIRSIMTLGEMVKLAQDEDIWKEALKRTMAARSTVGDFKVTDYRKSLGYMIDGFGSLREYYGSDFVEVLTFEGDYLDRKAMTLHEDQQIIVIDRNILVTQRAIPSPLGKRRISHAGWRKRPDNLYAMGPLDNLVGMQYRIDHLENLKADAQDLMVHPPLVIEGDVDPFIWEPNAEIHITGEGSVKELGMNLNGVAMANNEIAILEQRMEEFAGAPKQAMGIRTPGEKTAFEVQSLDNAAGRIFQEKIINFEINDLEPTLNSMLADAVKEMDGTEVVRTLNEELGIETFLSLTSNDLMAEGVVRPIGARHFGQQAQLLQGINTALNGVMGQLISPHMSGKGLARLLEDSLQLKRYDIVRPFIGMIEQAEGQQLAGALQQEIQSTAATPTEDDVSDPNTISDEEAVLATQSEQVV